MLNISGDYKIKTLRCSVKRRSARRPVTCPARPLCLAADSGPRACDGPGVPSDSSVFSPAFRSDRAESVSASDRLPSQPAMTSRAACLSRDRPAGGRRRLLAAWCYLRGGSAQGPLLPWPTGRQSPRSNGQFPSLAARRADSDGPPCGEARRTAVAPLGARAVSPRHHSQYPGAKVSTTSNQHKLILRGPAAPASGSQYPYVCARSSGAMIVRDPCPPMQLGLRASVTCWRASAACVRPIRLGPGPVARPDSGLSFPTSAARRPGPSGPTRVSR